MSEAVSERKIAKLKQLEIDINEPESPKEAEKGTQFPE